MGDVSFIAGSAYESTTRRPKGGDFIYATEMRSWKLTYSREAFRPIVCSELYSMTLICPSEPDQ